MIGRAERGCGLERRTAQALGLGQSPLPGVTQRERAERVDPPDRILGAGQFGDPLELGDGPVDVVVVEMGDRGRVAEQRLAGVGAATAEEVDDRRAVDDGEQLVGLAHPAVDLGRR